MCLQPVEALPPQNVYAGEYYPNPFTPIVNCWGRAWSNLSASIASKAAETKDLFIPSFPFFLLATLLPIELTAYIIIGLFAFRILGPSEYNFILPLVLN
jgi:hypothetical protein